MYGTMETHTHIHIGTIMTISTLFSANVSHKIRLCLCLKIEFDTQFSCYFRLTFNEVRAADTAIVAAVVITTIATTIVIVIVTCNNNKIQTTVQLLGYKISLPAHSSIQKCVSEDALEKTVK